MSTAEPLPDNIRRIAVLVSSVDSATSRQLLLHLPTHVAKQVRRALQNLGTISPSERQRILAEFQSTAARQSAPIAPQPTASAPATTRSSYDSPSFEQAPFVAHQPLHASHSSESLQHQYSGQFAPEQSLTSESQPTWAKMDIRALSHFLRTERPSVIAVVINQLSPNTGVALLQQLPLEIHREVLQAIANLQEIDSEAMQAIEEHLSERLKDYETKIDSEAKGTRRVAALLAAAPPELQETWSRFVHIAVDSADDAHSNSQQRSQTQQTTSSSQVSSAPPNDRFVERSLTPVPERTAQRTNQQIAAALNPQVFTTADQPLTPQPPSHSHADDDERSYILPFPGNEDQRPMSAVDRSLIQLEFEQILSLSPHQLAQILTAVNSQTVLLALAGASPGFMKRFYTMLNKPDAKALASRLSQIGPLKLRDIDEAQRSISELAAKLSAPQLQSQNARRRVAA